jgi:hypothetical protein
MNLKSLKTLGLRTKTKCCCCLENPKWRLVLISVAGLFAAFFLFIVRITNNPSI